MFHFNKFLFVVILFLYSISNYAQSFSNLDFGNENTFDVVTWNLETFPKLDFITENYVSNIITELESEIIGFQEINDITAFNTMMASTLGYTGYVLDANYGGLNLAYAIKNDLNVIDDYAILASSNYNYAFAGRPPYLIHVEKNNVEYYVINVHLKCCGDGNLNTSNSSDEENRRLVALNHIKSYVDNNLSSENVLVIGDYNDELDDNMDNNVFQNFIDDSDDYLFADMSIATGNPQNFSFPNWPSHIDHILITNELFDEFNSENSDITTIQVDNHISGGFSSYDTLITDHMPVGISLVYSSGCTDPLALNYNPDIISNDSSCTYETSNENMPLFFSEYAEGSSNNKYLEIYNPTQLAVSLENYALALVINAPAQVGVYDSWHYFDIGSTVPAKGVFIIAHPYSDTLILDVANMTTTHLSNGNDGIALVYGNEPSTNSSPSVGGYTVVDRVGDWNGDPGNGWSVAGVSNATKNHTLIRKCSVSKGNEDWTASSGSNVENSEWQVLSDNDWSDLGQHYHPCEIIVEGCTDTLAYNYNPIATLDDSSCITESNSCDYVPSGLFVDNIIHNRVKFNWLQQEFLPSHYMIRYRPVGTSSYTVLTAGPVNSSPYNGTSRTRYFMYPETTYEWNIRARVLYEDGTTNCQSLWSASSQFTTLPACPNLQNLSVSTEANWVTLNADAPSEDWGVWQSRAKMKEVGTNSFRYANGDASGNINVLKGNFSPNTEYQWHTKAWCTGNVDEFGNSDPQYHSGWGTFSSFSTKEICDKMPINLTSSSNSTNTAITMSWDTPLSGEPDHYFLELNNDITGQQWQWNNIAGEQTSKTKFNLSSGDYFWRIRGACGENGTSWATIFTQPVYYTLGGERLDNEIVSDLNIYPNPSSNIFNLEFNINAETEILVTNVLGEQVHFVSIQSIGKYNTQIDLSNYTKGVYNLTIKTSDGISNHKLILQSNKI